MGVTMKPPMVTAVMVTGKSPKREELARISIKSFLDQTYRRRELVIINEGDYELKIGHPIVREIKVPKGSSLGELRNLGIEHAKGQWIIQWDDDDYHHPHRILYQMAHRTDAQAAVLLRKQMRVDIVKGEVICIQCDEGIAGTILHSAETDVRYAPLGQAEDSEFVKGFGQVVILDNDSETWPGPALYLRFFHGDNVMSHEHVMGGKESFTYKWLPHREERDYVSEILSKKYGITTEFPDHPK